MLNGIWQGVFGHLSNWLLGLIIAALTAAGLGCTLTTVNRGSWRLDFGSHIGVVTEADSANPASVNMDFKAVEEWIRAQSQKDEMGPPEPAPAPEPTEPAPTP